MTSIWESIKMIKFKHRANSLMHPRQYKAVEVDVRSDGKNLVVGHDWDKPDCYFLNYLEKCTKDSTLAINVKEDGLCDVLCDIMSKFKVRDYFFFDMSVPDLLNYIKKCPEHTAFRMSEFENKTYTKCGWVWLDYFNYENYILYKKYNYHLNPNKYKIVVVSPELHNIHELELLPEHMNYYGICTDYIELK